MTIAVDFDGTIVTHAYPAIGKELPGAIDTLKRLQSEGHRLILWTVREGKLLDEAVEYCRNRGLEFFSVNENYTGEIPRLLTETVRPAVSSMPTSTSTTATLAASPAGKRYIRCCATSYPTLGIMQSLRAKIHPEYGRVFSTVFLVESERKYRFDKLKINTSYIK